MKNKNKIDMTEKTKNKNPRKIPEAIIERHRLYITPGVWRVRNNFSNPKETYVPEYTIEAECKNDPNETQFVSKTRFTSHHYYEPNEIHVYMQRKREAGCNAALIAAAPRILRELILKCEELNHPMWLYDLISDAMGFKDLINFNEMIQLIDWVKEHEREYII